MVTQSVDFKTWENNYIALYAEQGEVNSRYIKAFFKNSDSTNLSLADRTVTFYAKKPDQTQIFNNCTINTIDNSATVKLTSQMLSVSGVVECEFQIFEGTTVLLKMSGLKIVVAPTGGFSEVVESTSEYNALTTALVQAQTFSDNTGDIDDLTTTDKTSLVAAINELNAKTLPISQGGTGGTTATSARTNLDVMHATTLYSNASGTNGTITLSDNVSNYSIIRFYYMGFAARQSCDVDVDTLANSEVCLQVNYCNSAQVATWSKSCLLSVSGNTLTFSRNTSVKIDSNGVSFDTTTTERMYILKVVGYKY